MRTRAWWTDLARLSREISKRSMSSKPELGASFVLGRGHVPKLEHLGLEPSLQEVLGLESEHVVETHASVVEHTDTDETTDEGVALEEALGVLVVEFEELTGSTTDLASQYPTRRERRGRGESVLCEELTLDRVS
jgi:hypothetical protein